MYFLLKLQILKIQAQRSDIIQNNLYTNTGKYFFWWNYISLESGLTLDSFVHMALNVEAALRDHDVNLTETRHNKVFIDKRPPFCVFFIIMVHLS